MSKAGSQKGYQSKGERRNVARSTLKLMKPTKSEKFRNKFEAYLNGKDPWFTIENPNKEQTNKRYIRVKASEYLGELKDRRSYVIKGQND